MRFRLKAGQHIQADYEAKPKLVKLVDADTGEITHRKKFPSKTFNVGEIVESDEDLALKHGEDKFQRLEPRTISKKKPSVLAPPTIHPTLPQQEPGEVRRPTMTQDQQKQYEEQLGFTDSGKPPEDPRVRDGRTLADPVMEPELQSQRDMRDLQDQPPELEAQRKQDHAAQDAELDRMTKPELKAFAEDNEIDLAGANSKADMLYMIREHRRNVK